MRGRVILCLFWLLWLPALASQEICRDAKKASLVDVASLAPTLRIDLRYASTNNFTGKQIYKVARCVLVRRAAEALVRVHHRLKEFGCGIVVFDAYRPHTCQKILWEYVPDDRFVANPKFGSRHNRGCAVDVTMYECASGKEVEMPSAFDDFSEKASRSFSSCSPTAIRNRELLERIMTEEGFIGLAEEWWHFDYKDWREHPLLDIPLENVEYAP